MRTKRSFSGDFPPPSLRDQRPPIPVSFLPVLASWLGLVTGLGLAVLKIPATAAMKPLDFLWAGLLFREAELLLGEAGPGVLLSDWRPSRL